MTKYGRSPWIDQFPKSRVPAFPRQRGAMKTGVVIVGGGLTGCATGYAFASAGVKVVLLEAEQLGRGNSGSASGWMADDPGVAFVDLEKTIGLGGARGVWRAFRRAALDFAALLRRLDVKCHLEARPAMDVAVTREQAMRLEREHKARRASGVDAPLLNARAIRGEVALDGSAALRGNGSTIDPYRACLGLAAAAAARGAVLFEHSPARKITFTRKSVQVLTAGGSISPNAAVANYVDYLDQNGVRMVATGSAFTRQWRITNETATLKRFDVSVTSNRSFSFGSVPATFVVTYKSN